MRKQIKKMTPERRALERRLKIVRDNYREAFHLEHGYIFCEGCGINEAGDKIDYSHTVGIGKNLALIDHPGNGALMCRRKCHPRVEARDLEGLHNEEKLVLFIQEHDPASLELKALENDLNELLEERTSQPLPELTDEDHLEGDRDSKLHLCVKRETTRPCYVDGCTNRVYPMFEADIKVGTIYSNETPICEDCVAAGKEPPASDGLPF